MLSCSAGAARCQTSASLTLLSSYTARGIMLDTRPTPQLRVEHDADDGWYAGGFVSPVNAYSGSQAQTMVYGGRARRITSTLTVDAGASHSMFSRDSRYGYSEIHAGLMLGASSVRLFYSPDYYGEGHSVYLDLNTAYPLGEKLGLALHAGLMHPSGEYSAIPARNAVDVRVGLAADVGDYRLQVGWQKQWRPYLYGVPTARAWTASASLYF